MSWSEERRIAMDNKKTHSFLVDIELPQPDTQDLRGRQSVRATFKLSSRAIDALSILAVHLGIKQKSLFDHLIEDVPSLNAIAREIETGEFRTLARVQKTFGPKEPRRSPRKAGRKSKEAAAKR